MLALFAATALADPPPHSYAGAIQALHARQVELAARFAADPAARPAIRDDARAIALEGITEDLIPAWYGTAWDFYGTTETPGEGEIACGYFVSTVLRDAGFAVERFKLAQQASEYIVLTLVPRDDVRRFRNRPAADPIAAIAAEDPGLWLVGLDNHVGFLWNDGRTVQMCHSSYLGEAVATCETAATSPAFESHYRVIGRLLEDPMIDAWLTGARLRTVTH
jgi:hypothetical protein